MNRDRIETHIDILGQGIISIEFKPLLAVTEGAMDNFTNIAAAYEHEDLEDDNVLSEIHQVSDTYMEQELTAGNVYPVETLVRISGAEENTTEAFFTPLVLDGAGNVSFMGAMYHLNIQHDTGSHILEAIDTE